MTDCLQDYRAGTLLSGQLKAMSIKALQEEVKSFQEVGHSRRVCCLYADVLTLLISSAGRRLLPRSTVHSWIPPERSILHLQKLLSPPALNMYLHRAQCELPCYHKARCVSIPVIDCCSSHTITRFYIHVESPLDETSTSEIDMLKESVDGYISESKQIAQF